MKILNEHGIEITSPDLSLGKLVEEKNLIKHHEAVEAVPEKGHYEVVAEYPNGGKDVKWVVDVPGVEAQEAWDEYEDIYRYVLYTEDELAKKQEEEKKQEGQRPVTWDELDAAYQSGYTEGYQEGVNSAYDE